MRDNFKSLQHEKKHEENLKYKLKRELPEELIEDCDKLCDYEHKKNIVDSIEKREKHRKKELVDALRFEAKADDEVML